MHLIVGTTLVIHSCKLFGIYPRNHEHKCRIMKSGLNNWQSKTGVVNMSTLLVRITAFLAVSYSTLLAFGLYSLQCVYRYDVRNIICQRIEAMISLNYVKVRR